MVQGRTNRLSGRVLCRQTQRIEGNPNQTAPLAQRNVQNGVMYHKPAMRFALALLALSAVASAQAPGTRVLVDCHNCYPYNGQWQDRADRALSTGLPVAIEQDLTWYVDPATGKGRVVDSHETHLSGTEPTLEEYFFQRVKPIVEKAMKDKDRSKWPLITLNLDLKSEQLEMLAALWKVIESHQDWLSYAAKPNSATEVTPITYGPILILTGRSDAQEKVFFTDRPVGSKLLLFGAVHSDDNAVVAPANVVMSENATAYRRWWNNPWKVIEGVQQPKAADWTEAENQRLKSFVALAHQKGLWLRFYTLDGASPDTLKKNGWFDLYSFGSLAEVQKRWKAAADAGVDYIASDQMEELAKTIRTK